MENKLTPNYFDLSKILIFLNRPHDIDALRKGDLKKSANTLSSFAHELFHNYLTLSTSFGIYEILLRTAFLIQTSATAINETKDRGTQLRLPFIKDIESFPELKYNYDFLKKFIKYIYPEPLFKLPKGYGTQNIKRIKHRDEHFKFYDFMNQKTPLLYPTFILHFDINGDKKTKYLPIGLQIIQDNFCRIVQDDLLRDVQSKEEYNKDFNFRINNELFLPYYILTHVSAMEFPKPQLPYFMALRLASYIAMMFLEPISCHPERDFYWGLNLKTADDAEFITSLTHPGKTFLCALDALKKAGESIKEPDSVALMNAACEEMRIPSVKEMNDNMKAFLYRIKGLSTTVLRNYPFLKHFIEISLEILKITEHERDLAIFLLRPSLNLKYIPSIVSDDRYIKKGNIDNEVLVEESSIIEQFLLEKRIFCSPKKFFGSNPRCENDKDCSIDKVDFPYSKCENDFLGVLEHVVGDVNKLVPS